MSKHSLNRFKLSGKLSSKENNLHDTATKHYFQYLGNKNPSHDQILEMKSLLFNVWLRRELIFDKQLTDRERQCLYQATHGKGIKETAHLLGITEIMVKTHRKSILSKLSCKNLTQAVAIGIKYGYLAVNIK